MALAHTLPLLDRAKHHLVERWTWAAAIGAVIAIGAVLRLIGARGELCLDEIWTLNQLEPVTAVSQILVHLSNDNNHFLNSIYIYAVGGSQSSPLLLRALSIALGSASVVAAGLVALRTGRPAALMAMLAFAVSYPLVHYGSEARGYAGLVLFSLIAIACLQRQLDVPDRITREILGLAIGLGFLSHLNMAAVATVLALWTAWAIWRRTGCLKQAAADTLFIFAPALAWTLAVGACLALGWHFHGFQIGNFPFDAAKFVDSYGSLLRLLIGLPEVVPAWLCLGAGVAGVAIAAGLWRDRKDHFPGLYVAGVVVLPAAMFVARLPNTEFPRHFLFSATVFLLFLADVLGRAWRRRGLRRQVAITIMLATVAGNAVSFTRFSENGRGHYADAVTEMAANGPFLYSSNHDLRNSMLASFYARKLQVSADYVPKAEQCKKIPDWWLSENSPVPLPDRLTLGADCSLNFERRRLFPVWGLSGGTLALYRRVP